MILSQAMISAALGFVVGGAARDGHARRDGRREPHRRAEPRPVCGDRSSSPRVMCAFAALLSIVKVLRLDPASVFKG